MSYVLRGILIVGSILFFVYLLINLRKTKISVDMSVIWIFLSCAILLMAIFPQPFITIIKLLGIESAINGVLIFFILALLLLVFYLFRKIALLNFKMVEIAQKIGIDNYKNKEKDNSKKGK